MADRLPVTQSVTEVLASRPALPWYKDANLRTLYLMLIPACMMVSANNGLDGSVISGFQSLKIWESDFNQPTKTILGIISAAYAFGAILSTPLSPIISDRYGRKSTIIIGNLIMILGVGLQAGAKSTGWFIGSRIVIGFGVTGSLASAPVLIAELAHPNQRAVFTALFNTTFYLGSIIGSWTTYGTTSIASSWSWRIPSIIQGVPAVITLIFIMLLPESPRWLMSKDRGTEAQNIIAKWHGNGDGNDELVLAECYEIAETLRLEKESAAHGVKQLWATNGNRHRMLIILFIGFFAQWTGAGLISYYISKILDSIGIIASKEQTLINGILTIVSWIVGVISATLVPRFKRRHMFLASSTLMLAIFTALTICISLYVQHQAASAAHAALGFIFLFNMAYGIAWGPLGYMYAAEILPFRIRAMGFGVLIFANKAALCFNQFVNPIGLAALGWKYYPVYIAVLAFMTLFVYFVFPETKGYTIEEAAVLFDGIEAQVVHVDEKDVDAGYSGGSKMPTKVEVSAV